MSLPARSQTVTSTPSDSLVLLPKQLAIYMLQDLTQCDSDRVELTIHRAQSALKDSIIDKQALALTHLQIRYVSMKEAYDLCTQDREALEVAVKDCDRRVKRVRSWSTVGWILSTVLVGALIVQ